MNQEKRVVRIQILPLLLGFVVLGALSHSAVRVFEGAGVFAAAPAPQPASDRSASLHLRALADEVETAAPRISGIHPVPVFILGKQELDRCGAVTAQFSSQNVCTWTI